MAEQAHQPHELPDPAVADPAEQIGERSAIVLLRYWDDLSDAQVAAILGCSPGTVRSQASRALAKLRGSAALADQGGPQ